MHDDLVQRCVAQFERHVDALVSFYKRGNILVSSPLFQERAVPIEEIPKLKHLVRNALHARAWFERHGPAWAQPLPLSEFERVGMLFLNDNALQCFAALYSISLQARDFDCLSHPLIFDYARGIMADPRTHEDLRMDPTLLAEFPPKELAGLDEHGRWRPLRHRESRLLEDLTIFPLTKHKAGSAASGA